VRADLSPLSPGDETGAYGPIPKAPVRLLWLLPLNG